MKTIFPPLLAAAAAILLAASPAATAPVDTDPVVGVTEPQEQIDLSFPEGGVIRSIAVEEGDPVSAGQVLAQLDCRVLESQLAIVRMRAESTAGIQSATATLDMRQQRHEQLGKLAASQNANADELARARAELEIARADVQLAHEAVAEHKLEAQQIEAQIEQRTLRAPFDGVVAAVTRDEAASVSPGDGPVIRLVKLDPLELVVHIDHRRLDGLETGQTLAVQAIDRPVSGNGVIAFISPTIDPSSGTARLRITLPNGDSRHRSGVKYRVTLPGPTVADAAHVPPGVH